jgi:hypothetical protein
MATMKAVLLESCPFLKWAYEDAACTNEPLSGLVALSKR